jgi:predicted ABC-type ATPase
MSKILYILIGPKGSGKTHIGALVDRHTAIRFISVEPLWLHLQPDEDGWTKVAQTIDAAFEQHDRVMIESLGAGEGFQRFHTALAAKYPIRMIRVHAALDTCLDRVQTRDSANQIAVSLEQVAAYNRIADQVEYDWALEIHNDPSTEDHDILAAFAALA